MTELQLFIAGVLAVVIAALLIAGLIGAAIARSKAKGATERAVAAALGRQPPKVDLLIQETPRGHWHYRASQNGHQLIPRRKGGHTSSAYALRAAKRILRVGSVEVMNYMEVQTARSAKARAARRARAKSRAGR